MDASAEVSRAERMARCESIPDFGHVLTLTISVSELWVRCRLVLKLSTSVAESASSRRPTLGP